MNYSFVDYPRRLLVLSVNDSDMGRTVQIEMNRSRGYHQPGALDRNMKW